MNTNLVLATGLAYTLLGAMMMFMSHRALYRSATSIVAGYPRVLAALRAYRHDGRFGLILLLCGSVLQVLGASGYSAPLAHWRYPAGVMVGALVLYGLWRLLIWRRATHAVSAERIEQRADNYVYQTRRSMILLEAARRESANRMAREEERGPRDRGVVYLAQEWECRWWSDRFGVSTAALKAAVREVGPMVADVERHLSTKARGRYAVAA